MALKKLYSLEINGKTLVTVESEVPTLRLPKPFLRELVSECLRDHFSKGRGDFADKKPHWSDVTA